MEEFSAIAKAMPYCASSNQQMNLCHAPENKSLGAFSFSFPQQYEIMAIEIVRTLIILKRPRCIVPMIGSSSKKKERKKDP